MNVLWITSDQHAHFASGCYGHPLVRTPNLDVLARAGLRFDAAYTPSPQCIPARDSLLCGRYPTWYPRQWVVPLEYPTAAHLFRQAGFVTAHIGKMHPCVPYTRGFDYLVDMGHYYDYLGPKVEIFGRGMQARNSGCGLPWMDPQWYRPASWLDRPLTPGLPPVLDDPDHFEAFVARTCQAFFKTVAHRPFFLHAAFLKPHFPFASPPSYRDLYRPEEIELPPPVSDAALAVADPWQGRNVVSHLDHPSHPAGRPDRRLDREEDRALARRQIADYFAAITYMDECLGRILRSLEEYGLADNTAVLYTTDHGEMLYHHGLTQKFVFFEQSARVPLVIRVPGLKAGATAALTDLTDLLPTSLALAGLAIPPDLDGVDLTPVLHGRSPAVRDACFSRLGDWVMIRCGPWKLCRYRPEQWHLFNLESDPGEHHNRYSALRDQADIAALRTRLEAFAAQGAPGSPGITS